MSRAAEIKLCHERLAYWRSKYGFRKAKFDHYNANVKRSTRMHHPIARRLAEALRSKWARSMGKAAREVNRYVKRLHELEPAETSVERKEHELAHAYPECHDGVRKVVAKILVANPAMYVTSTTGGHHAPGSLHYVGRAMDLGANSQRPKDQCGQWCNERVSAELTEGIHNPNLSIKNGQRVVPSFWGAETWAAHVNHVHIAV